MTENEVKEMAGITRVVNGLVADRPILRAFAPLRETVFLGLSTMDRGNTRGWRLTQRRKGAKGGNW
jgi:hypothetical protein